VAFFLLFSNMKNTISTIVAIIMALSFTMQSCSKDDGGSTTTTPTPTNNDTTKNDTLKKPKPTINWKTDASLKHQDGDEIAGNNIAMGVVATASSSEKITLVTLTVTVNGGVEYTLFQANPAAATYTNTWNNITLGMLPNGKNKYTATATQSNGEKSSVTFTITSTSTTRTTILVQNMEMGAQGTSTGSFLNPWLGAQGVSNLTDANAHPEKIGLIYYMGATNKATFSAADDADVTQIFSSVNSWATRKPSRFKLTTLTATQFDAIDPNDATVIDTQCGSGTFVSKVTQLKVGDVIAYREGDAQFYCLLKVTQITNAGMATSKITFDMVTPTF
jgi:hypothetical protein